MTSSAARSMARKESEAYAKRRDADAQRMSAIMARAMMQEIIRDLFAGQALQGLLMDDPVLSPTKDTAETYADAAYVYADAMLKRRKRA